MPKTYSPAPDDVRTVVNEMLKKHYPELIKFGVTIDLISVAHDNEDKPALTLHGYPAAAVIRVVGIKERTKGAGDVEICIDEERWMDFGTGPTARPHRPRVAAHRHQDEEGRQR